MAKTLFASFLTLLKVVILHIQLKGMDHKSPGPYTHLQPIDGVKRLKPFFVRRHVAYRIRRE